MVGSEENRNWESTFVFPASKILTNSSPFWSLPNQPIVSTEAPKAQRLRATLAAPPATDFSSSTARIGTGASGEILLTCPMI